MEKKDLWNVRIGLLSAAIAVLGIVASVFIYVDGLKKSIDQEHKLIEARDDQAYRRQLWDERRAAYKQLAETLGAVAAEIEVGKTVSKESLEAFHKTYWGALILVENETIENEMVKLKNDLRDLVEGRISSDKIKLRIQKIVRISREHIEKGFD
jgi:hypothetical protein